MRHELTNLLPPDRIRALKRDYFLRLGTTTLFVLAAVALMGVALLAPVYLSLQQESATQQARLQELDTQLAASGGKETGVRLSALATSVTYLARLATTTTATNAVRGVLETPRSGIMVTGITFVPGGAGGSKMTLLGMARTREELRAYANALSALPFITNVDLPISSYAKEKDIPFNIALTGTFLP